MNRLIGWSEVAIGLAHKTLAVLLAALLCLSGMPVMALAYEGDAAVESSEIVDPLPEAETQSGEAVRSGDADIATDADMSHDRSATNSLGDEVDRAADEGRSHDGIDPELEQPRESAGDSGGEAMETSSEDAAMQIGFVYIDKSIVDSADAQDVVVALSDESAQLTDATLEYEAEGAQYVEAATMLDRNAARFQLKNLPPGDYRLAGLSYQIAGEEEWSRLDFGGEGYEFIVSSPKEPEVQTCALSTEGDDVEAMVEDAVTGAIEEGNSNISLLSLSGNARSLSPRVSSDSGIVVALDPGHGGSDPGAVANGLQEKSINLKIAQYCRAALQAHGVKVFMTRSDDSYVGLSERVQRAVAAGASIFVSIHINSATPAASGCEVFIPNDSSYNHDTHVVGKELGEKIIAQLTKLGLPNRGVKIKDSESGAKDPDGNLADYYSVINQSRKNNIPGIIVEHAFITNSGEAVKLQSESFLKQLGEADARGILEALDVGSLYNDGKGYRYRQADGTDACDTWMTIDGRRYYFGSDGYAAVWNRQIGGDWYYFDGAGRMVTGWVVGNNDGLRLYFDPSTGKRTHGWKTLGAARYWFDPATGKAAVWNRQIGGDWYYFDGAGRMVTGWVVGNNDGLRLYFDPSTGKRQSGWRDYAGSRYYLSPATGKSVQWNRQIDGDWYYFDGAGRMVTGWVVGNNDGLRLYFDPSTGKRQSGWRDYSGSRYYLSPATGKSVQWNQKIGGDWYYFDGRGRMVTGWVVGNNDGLRLYFDPATGKRTHGWKTLGAARYWFDPATGKAAVWNRQIDGDWYYFDGAGRMVTGMVTGGDDGLKRYFDPKSGARQSGWKTIDKKTYYFDPSTGKSRRGKTVIEGNTYYFNNRSEMHVGWLTMPDGSMEYYDAHGRLQPQTIMGTACVSVQQLVSHFNARGSYPSSVYAPLGASTITAFCTILYEEALAEGVRPEVLYAQAMHETGYFKFGGDVKPGQCNFGGLGATGNGAAGLSFSSVRQGLRAQVQHLKAYGSTEPLKNSCVDPRFNFVKRGSAILVSDLTGKWASDPQYGSKLLKILEQLG